jgi:thiol:disulfide interchange protein DsbD
MRILAFLFALFLSFPAHAQDTVADQAPIDGDGKRVMLRLWADRDAAIPGQTLKLAVEQLILPGWHTYWLNPGDSGEPMKIKWGLPQGYKVSDLLWPAPDHVPYGPLMNYGYADRALMLADLEVPANAKPGSSVAVRGKASVLVCDEICIPESHDIALDLPVASASNPANQDIFTAAGQALPQPVDWQTVTEADANEVRIRITLPSYAFKFADDLDELEFFPFEWGYVQNAGDQTVTFEPSTGTLTLRQPRDLERDITALKNAAYVIKSPDAAYQVSGPVVIAGAPVIGQDIGAGADLPLFTLLAFAFIGGVILNLMPCVFPILSMKALHLVSLPKAERTHARASGLLYAAGIIVMFLGLAGILIALRGAGEQLGWGFQLQNPPFVAALAWLMLVIGLNLAGAFDLRIAFGGEVLLAEKHHPLAASFLTGVLATLVATPCSAPFMATAIGAALVQTTPIALLIFAALGLGLAAPFLLLSFVPAAQKILPRPGAWMETFRQILAFPMFASAVWLVWVVSQQGGPTAVGWTLAGMVSLAFAIWLVDRRPSTRAGRSMVMLAGLLVIGLTFAGLTLVVALPSEDEAAIDVLASKAYDPESLDHALNDTKAPVFVNMTASWCITCLVNEKVTLSDPEVQDLFSRNQVTYIKGDWTNKDPAITNYLSRFNRSGVPIYVFYGAPDADGHRPPPQVLPQILSVETLQALFP